MGLRRTPRRGDVAGDALGAELRADEHDRAAVTARDLGGDRVHVVVTLRNLGRLDEATKAATASVATLGDLRAKGDTSEPTTIGLAMGTSANVKDHARAAGTSALRPSGLRRTKAGAIACTKP